MPALDDILREELVALEQAGRKRTPQSYSRGAEAALWRGSEPLVSFSCNDYLGLSHHPAVKSAALQAIERHGLGAGASRLVTGNHPLYEELESLLAELKGTEAACVFASGYATNLGVISALTDKPDLVLFDRLAHASLIDGTMLSGATWLRFKHNDVADCERLLAASRPNHRRCLIVTETVFSMDGDRAPVAELYEIARQHDAWLLTDDAHGLGVGEERSMGQEARSGGRDCQEPAERRAIAEVRRPEQGALNNNLIQTGTLSKSVGAMGGYVCGSRTLIDHLHSAARPLIYSTALPPAILAAAIASLRLMQSEPELCERAMNNARFFCSQLGLPEPQSAIVPMIMGEEERAMDASKRLREAGFLVAAIRPPTVPPGTSRLRFTFSAVHREEDIERLCALVRVAGWHKRSMAA